MARSRWTLCAAVLGLAGCVSLAPDYQRPEAPVPKQWPDTAAGAPAPADRVSTLAWRAFFGDEHLQQLIEQALANNRDLRFAVLNVERARGLYGIQRGELYPSFSASASAARLHESADLVQPGQSRTASQYSVDLGLAAWEIDFFGRLRNLSQQALEEFFATEAAQRATHLAIVAEVARAYYTLAADQELLQLVRSTLESQQEAYNLVKRRFEVGLATELDLKRAQTPLEVARADLARTTQQVALDVNALVLLLGGGVTPAPLPQGLSVVTPPREIEAGLSSEVLLDRPDIVAAEHRLKGAYAAIGAARATLFPRISLTASVGTASNELAGLFESGTGTWAFVPQLALPIFDTRLWAAIRVRESERALALNDYERSIQVAFREVADALAVQKNIGQQLDAQQAVVAAAADTYRLALRRYQQGIDNYLSVLDAQRALFAAQQQLIVLRLEKIVNQSRLYAVLGGGAE